MFGVVLRTAVKPVRKLMAVRIESQAEPIPGYKLVERLGGGGFGEVWKAIAPGGLPKAIKFVYGDLQAASADGVRAEQELKALSRVKAVRHPYILSLERYDIIDGQLLIVMELADRNLWDRFKECRAQGLPGIPRDELLRYMQETSEALDLMNVEYQLQHLDIKPQNLFLVHNHAKVADFGLVKDLQGMMASVTGGITPVYAAPETFDGWISRFCDQYSLAIVYQELLTGQRPFNGTNVGQLIMQHLRATPNLASLPAAEREVIARALSKSPDARFPRCQDFVRALTGNSARETSPPVPAPAGGQELSQESRLTTSTASEDTPTHTLARLSGGGDLPNPAATESTRWIRVSELTGAKPQEQPAGPLVAPQVQPGGTLFPALVIGLGQTGLAVLQRLRQSFKHLLGAPDALPNIRSLYIDTDPDALQLAAHAEAGMGLPSSEVLQTRLNRPSHYLRAHGGRPRFDPWFDTKMLYRIPRRPVTMGLRLLGRLAFFDHYRAIAARLTRELEACTRPEVLARVVQQQGSGLRNLRPRVYVLANLAGGTGGGMFLDLAYLLRKLIKAQGHDCPDIVGVFLMPAADRSSTETMALGNTFAALTELNHFSAPDTSFWAHYDERDAPIRDAEPPYNRCIVLPLPAGQDDGPLCARAGLIADWLYRDLTSALGRTADESRAGLPIPVSKSWSLTCQTFGMYRISWPRASFLRAVGRKLCQQLVRGWMSKDATPIRERVQTAVAEEWSRLGLAGDALLLRLQNMCEQAFEQNPEDTFAAILEPLAGLEAPGADLALAADVLDQLEQLVGRPEDGAGSPKTSLEEPLDTAADALSAGLAQKLNVFITGFIEESGLRLAGAEEAVRQTISQIQQHLQNHESVSQELALRVENARARIESLLASLLQGGGKGRRTTAAVSTLLELCRCYPKWRYQSLLFQRLAKIYVSLRGGLSDQLREFNYCRARLTELLASFQQPDALTTTEESGPWSRLLFPEGLRDVTEAANQMLETVTPEEVGKLDLLVQQLLQQQFLGLANICLGSSSLLIGLEQVMQGKAEEFVAGRLAGMNVANMYLAEHPDENETVDDLDAAFERAAPELTGTRGSTKEEICILAAPPGPVGERFRDLARRVLSDVDLVTATVPDDIIFYREVSYLRLADLEQLGPLGYEAYRQVITLRNFTPHSRIDINEWRAAGG
jgi:serine/threonine protein kinase